MLVHIATAFQHTYGHKIVRDYVRANKHLADEEPISVTRTTSASRSPYGSSRSRSPSRSPRHDDVVLNLDTKSTKVLSVTDDDEVTAFEKPSPKAKESIDFKSRLEEAFHSSIQQEHASSGSGAIRKVARKFSPAEDIESRPGHVEPEANGYVNGLEVHHHLTAAKSRKVGLKDEPAIDSYAAAKEKPHHFVPKTIEQLEFLKNSHKYSSEMPSSLLLPLPFTHRPDFFHFPIHYNTGTESALPFLFHNFAYQQQIPYSIPAEDCYRNEPPKDARPPSPIRRPPSKEASFYPPRVEPSHPNQSSAVEPIH